MTCLEFADFMMDYFSNELPAAVRREFDRHLSVCPNCRKYLAGYDATIKLGKQAFEDGYASLPDDVPEELVRGILDARNRL